MNRMPSTSQLHTSITRHTILLSLALAGICHGEPSVRVAVQSGTGIESIGRGISINDRGDIGFMGVTSQGHNVFCINGETGQQLALMNRVFMLPAEGDSPTQTMGEYVEVNNQREVLAQRRLNAVVQVGGLFGSILTAPVTYIERWPHHGNRSVPGRIGLPNSLVAMGDGGAGAAWSLTSFLNPVTGRVYPSAFNQDGGFDGVMPNTAFNNLGQAVFSALRGGEWSVVTRPANFLGAGNSNGVAQPQLADSGNFTLRSSGETGSSIYWFSYDFGTFERVAHNGNGFGDKGLPGVDDGGTVMVFCADLSPGGAAQLDLTQADLAPIGAGPGLFYSTFVGGTRVFRRLAGVAGNGSLDPGEFWGDDNGNGRLDQGEDRGIVGSFDYRSRACVNRIATQFNPDREGVVGFGGRGYLAAFAGTDHEGKASVFTVEFGELGGAQTKAPTVFVRQGEAVAGLSGRPAEFHLHDAVNHAGVVACWTRTDSGATAILTGPARKVSHLHVLTHGFGNPSRLKIPFFGETEPIGLGDDFLDSWTILQQEIASLPGQYATPAKQAELDGAVASYVSNWPSSDGWFQAIISVLASGLMPTGQAELLHYARNEMARAALHAESAAENIVDDLFSTGLLGQEQVPEIHLVGHSRGAAVNSRVARLLYLRGITPAQFTALDGYSTDWPALSGILGDLSIVAETAEIQGMRKVNVRVDDGFDEIVLRAILDAGEALDARIAAWLGIPAPAYADAVVETLKRFTLGWKAPERAGFENYVLTGCTARPGIGFTHHLNITEAYTYCDRVPRGLRAIMDGPLGYDILSPAATPARSPRGHQQGEPSGLPLGIKDGDFDELGALATRLAALAIPEALDPVFETYVLAMQRPEFIMASSWDLTGDVTLVSSGDGYAAQLAGGGGTSMSQLVKFAGASRSVEFDLDTITPRSGASLEVFAGDVRIGRIDLTNPGRTHAALSLFGIPSRVTTIDFRLAGGGGAGAAVVAVDNIEITDAKGDGYPELTVVQDPGDGVVTLTLTGAPGRAFRIQASPDLKNWADIAEPMNFSGEEVFRETPPAGAGRRYYRVAW